MRRFIILFFCCASFIAASGQQICFDEQLREGDAFVKAGQIQEAINSWKAGIRQCRDLSASQLATLNSRIRDAENAGVVTPSVTTMPTRQSYEPEMVSVQGGTFQMGSNNGESDEKPVHSVTVSSFSMGKYEVTQKQWREVMGSDPSELYFKGCDQCPVERVSWIDIQEYLKKINEKTGKKYRLPTEAEWEFAARGGNQSKNYTYSGSNDLKSVAWFTENSESKTHPVGQKQANELGLFDMSGNVWEWCSDWYSSSYSSGAVSNPTGAVTGANRVFRGGSWGHNAASCRSANRNFNTPTIRSFHVGFRVVFSL